MNCKIYLKRKLEVSTLDEGYGIIVLKSSAYSEAEISQIKEKGYRVLAHMSIGSIEKANPAYPRFKKFELGNRSKENMFVRFEDEDEVYVDVREKEWRDFLVGKAKELKEKGFSGWLLDGLDVYTHTQTSKMFVACAAVIGKIKRLGGYVMVCGGDKFFERAIDQEISLVAVDGVVEREVFSRIALYKGREKFSRQKKARREFLEENLRKLRRRGLEIYLVEFVRNEEVENEIRKWCMGNRVGFLIFDFVDF